AQSELFQRCFEILTSGHLLVVRQYGLFPDALPFLHRQLHLVIVFVSRRQPPLEHIPKRRRTCDAFAQNQYDEPSIHYSPKDAAYSNPSSRDWLQFPSGRSLAANAPTLLSQLRPWVKHALRTLRPILQHREIVISKEPSLPAAGGDEALCPI